MIDVEIGVRNPARAEISLLQGPPIHLGLEARRTFYLVACASSRCGLDLLLVDVSTFHSDTPQPIGLLWTSDRPVAETGT